SCVGEIVECRLSLPAAVPLSAAFPGHRLDPDYGGKAEDTIRYQSRRSGGRRQAVSQELFALQKGVSSPGRAGGGGRKRGHGKEPSIRRAVGGPAEWGDESFHGRHLQQ